MMEDSSLEFDMFEDMRRRLVEVLVSEGCERLDAEKIALYVVQGTARDAQTAQDALGVPLSPARGNHRHAQAGAGECERTGKGQRNAVCTLMPESKFRWPLH